MEGSGQTALGSQVPVDIDCGQEGRVVHRQKGDEDRDAVQMDSRLNGRCDETAIAQQGVSLTRVLVGVAGRLQR